MPLLTLILVLQSALGQSSYMQDTRHFDYDPYAALNVQEISVREQGDVSIHDLTYVSPKGGKVPAYLVVPDNPGKTRLAGIVWGHWMMPKSPTANRGEFLDEAVALAPTGAVSLLIDTPQVRPGFQQDPDPLSPQPPEVLAQQVVDLRRGLDLLLSRGSVDRKRIAYVGHSFDAAAGAILDAIDKRPAAFVFMGGPQSIREYVLSADTPDIAAFRKMVPAAKIQAYLDTYAWADPGTYQTHLGPAPALFQYATHDDFVPLSDAKRYFAASSGPKQMNLYDSDHALNAEARRDRFEFLRSHLGLAPLSSGVLEKIPLTK